MKFRMVMALMLFASAGAGSQTPAEQLGLAERDFQAATLQRGVAGWNSFFADSGAQLQNTSRVVRGHAAIRNLMGAFLASKTELLIWWPVATEISEKGDMAYTFGGSGVVSADSTGRLGIAGRGTYLTVWRREKGGSWKVTADMGGQASAAALERAADTTAAREITLREDARRDAIQDANRAALEGIYSFDFLDVRFGAPPLVRGTMITRLLQTGKFDVSRLEESKVTVAGETGIVSGVLRSIEDEGAITRTSFLNIYVRRAGKWVFIRGVSNRLK